MPAEIIKLKSWEDFESKISDELQFLEELRSDSVLYVSPLLFRGLGDESWGLETTLERFTSDRLGISKNFSWKDYYDILRAIKPSVHSLTSHRFELPETFQDKRSRFVPPGYPLMVYTRHHGFPSPLLDWTRSPYVAAFFAFSESRNTNNVSIYSYLEYKAKAKSRASSEPQIVGLGPYVETHSRHYLQQCQYTVCIKEDHEKNKVYWNHEDVAYGEDQDILKKYIIPISEREKVMRKLDILNINAFSLFGNEEGLMDMLAYREFETRKR